MHILTNLFWREGFSQIDTSLDLVPARYLKEQRNMADSSHQKASYVPRPPAVLFYHKSMSQLAESICERCSHALKSPIVTEVGYFR